ncbi:uncharacterized protein K489DRAFT_41634 [Dissoconium aciculare CBS 342.82]|uniref:Uncharacterized protein n=1 Tax=Dissoconium aciculare CBS 342.82 TaxID=1314786 RepID=A0A6J3LZR5_9PEZI|nr:uncharacterized protein K489DRAFT_41634 [Dissoconium aciculare CBS 342.82]KAF1820749.1 hypothetical protein K489DRAFT_41634 [Dissoconium aciculare CBS 342.82]
MPVHHTSPPFTLRAGANGRARFLHTARMQITRRRDQQGWRGLVEIAPSSKTKKTTMAGERETQRVGRRAKKASRWKLIATSATTRAAVPSSSAAADQPASHAHYYYHSFSPLQRTLFLHTRSQEGLRLLRTHGSLRGGRSSPCRCPLHYGQHIRGRGLLICCPATATRARAIVCVRARCCSARGWRDGVLLDANGLLLREGRREREAPVVRNCREVM